MEHNARLFTFVGGNAGTWEVTSLRAVTGDGLDAVDRLRIVSGEGLFVVWGVAILCALISLAIYLFRRKTWYVWINLLVNIAGLLFTLFALFVVLTWRGGD